LEFLRKINIEASIALDEPMSAHTTLRIGGPADALVAPASVESLALLVAAARAEGLPLFFLGGGANILVGDRGIRGFVVDLRFLDGLRFEDASSGRTRVRAGAGMSMGRLCELCLSRGLSGLETFYGMPGRLGGSVYMNARCYEVEMSERLAEVDYLDAAGTPRTMRVVPGDWSYKRSPFQRGGSLENSLILGASFDLAAAETPPLLATMLEKRGDREAKGHYRLPSAGSFFKNDRRLGRPTGRILDELGFRGRRVGDAMVSDWHANIFVNAGRARAADMLALVELAKEAIHRATGVEIEAEVLFIGENQA
jgi:UDP-N-acetylmuramate dehydrogenase